MTEPTRCVNFLFSSIFSSTQTPLNPEPLASHTRLYNQFFLSPNSPHVWWLSNDVTHQWVMSRTWMSHITGVHECVCVRLEGEKVWALDEWVMSHINESCHMFEFVTLYMYVGVYAWEGGCKWVWAFSRTDSETHLLMWQDSFKYVTSRESAYRPLLEKNWLCHAVEWFL